MPLYLKELVQKNPKIISGRKNFSYHHQRIMDTIKIIKNYFKAKIRKFKFIIYIFLKCLLCAIFGMGIIYDQA